MAPPQGACAQSLAVFDPARTYRYRLRRAWAAPPAPVLIFLLLNPSTADATQDDPTLRRCVGFARRWGFGALEVVNLFAYRSPDPNALHRVPDPIGADNDRHILDALRAADLAVAAWGAGGSYLGRGEVVAARAERLTPLWHLGLTAGGQPRHPLYLPATTRPSWWREAGRCSASAPPSPGHTPSQRPSRTGPFPTP